MTSPAITALDHSFWAGLTTADKISLVNAAIAGLSALFAFGAAIIASRALFAQVQLARLERRYTAFRGFVADPSHASLHQTEDLVADLLEKGEVQIRTMIAANAVVNDIRRAAEQLANEFKSALGPSYYRVVGSANQWDSLLGSKVQQAFEALEDEITLEVGHLISGEAQEPRLASRAREGMWGIAALIAHYDVEKTRKMVRPVSGRGSIAATTTAEDPPAKPEAGRIKTGAPVAQRRSLKP